MNLANMKRSETTEQIGLINWARANEEYVPELRLLHHIPNEGIRTNGPVLKAAGMKAGVPDLSLPVPRRGFHGLYIEMKFGKGKTTKAQEEFMALLREQGYKTAVAYGAEQAREVIRHYLARGEGFDLVNCEEAVKMFGRCEGVPAAWAPCQKCEFSKRERKGNSYVFQNVGIEKIIQRRIQRRRPYSRTHDRSGRRRSGRLLYFFRLVGDLVQQLDIPERSEGGNY